MAERSHVRRHWGGAMSESSTVRYDGVYQGRKYGHGPYTYIRFYSDGTVITVSSTGRPEKIARWFFREFYAVSRGTYVISGNRVKFTTTSPEAEIAYEGVINGEQIEFRWKSRRSRLKRKGTVTFVKIELKDADTVDPSFARFLCLSCNGSRRVPCPSCNGRRCSNCFGGLIICPRCRPRGWVSNPPTPASRTQT
jgi:hypothetical protein